MSGGPRIGTTNIPPRLRAPGFVGGSGMPIRYDAIWEFGFLEDLIGRDKVILQADFDVLLQEKEVRRLRVSLGVTCACLGDVRLLRRGKRAAVGSGSLAVVLSCFG